MHPEPLRRLVRSLCQAAEPPGGEPLGDAELLRRFVTGHDEAAFELLLWRHGPMVLAVCRRLLRHADDAEDAFQATFLTFVRKAGSIGRGGAVGGWLHRVACRVALRARAARARRDHRERPGVEPVAEPARADPAWQEVRQVVDEELDHLPARQRAAFVLCCLEGKSGAEAARQLGCSPGTVSSRLTRARQRLQYRLARRGLAPSAVAFAAALAREASAAPLRASLVDSTLKGALSFASGKTAAGVLSGRAVSLAEGALRAMFLTRLRIAALLVLVAGLLVAGGVLARHALEAAPADEARPGKPGARPHDGPAVVHVVKPQPGGLERMTSQGCDVHAFVQVDLDAEVSGRLKTLSVDIGDHVKKGQLLAEIDAPLLALEEKQAAAAAQQAKGAVREAQARIATVQASVVAAENVVAQKEAEVGAAKATLTFREQQLARYKDLRDNKSIDQRFVDEAESQVMTARGQLSATAAAVKTAKAELDIQKSKVTQAEAGLETARADLAAAEVTLEKAQYLRSLTRVVSPVDGVVTRRSFFPGDHVGPAGGGTPGRLPLLTVQGTDRVRVVTEVPDRDVPLTHPGVPVDLTFDALPGVRFPGLKVTRIAFVEDPKTRTMRVEIDVPNLREQLRPGMYGKATLDLGPGAPDALRLPRSATLHPDPRIATLAVYVVRDGKAHLTRIRVENATEQEVEIASGLKADDVVVADPKGLKGEVVPVKVSDRPGK